MGILLLLVRGCCELLLFVVEGGPPFGVNSMEVLSDHAGCFWLLVVMLVVGGITAAAIY